MAEPGHNVASRLELRLCYNVCLAQAAGDAEVEIPDEGDKPVKDDRVWSCAACTFDNTPE